MSDESMNSLEDLLDQHDYDMPQAGDIRMGVIVATTAQGFIIDLGLKRDGIVPQSDLAKLEPEERDALKINDEVPVYVIQTEDPEALVVSIHLARLNQDWIEAEAMLANGQVYEGEVIGYNKGGVIVPYGRIRGFVPISHLSDVTPGMGERRRQQRLARLRGEMIGVKIIEVDRQRHRLVMSQREAQKEWEEKKRGELMETLKPGDIRSGRISGMREFGAFVDLGGADGLVHISELSWHRIDHPREVVKLGDEVEVYVLGVDQESGRISLSRKKLLPNPWDTVAQRYGQNQLVEGRITRILDYGAFAEIEPGVEGLLHVSQLSRAPVEDPRSVVQEGEVHLLRVVSIDQKRQRIGLSLKAVTPTEQIEWMAQKELAEAMRQEEEEATAAARASTRAEAEESDEAEQPEEQTSATTDTDSPAGEPVAMSESVVEQAAAEVMPEAEVQTPAAEEEVSLSPNAVEEGTGEPEAEEVIDDPAEELAEPVESAAEAIEEAVESVEESVTESEPVESAAEAVEEAVESVEESVTETEPVESAAEIVEEEATEFAEESAEALPAAEEMVELGEMAFEEPAIVEAASDSDMAEAPPPAETDETGEEGEAEAEGAA